MHARVRVCVCVRVRACVGARVRASVHVQVCQYWGNCLMFDDKLVYVNSVWFDVRCF